MTKKFLLLTTLILSSSLYSEAIVTYTIKSRNGKVYPNAKIFHNKNKNVIAEFECGKRIVFNQSEILETEAESNPLTRWKTQEECDQAEEEARQAAEKRKEEKRLKEEQRQQELALKKQADEKRKQEEAKRKEEKRLQEEQRRQELALKKQECEANGNIWNGKDCRKKSVMPVVWSYYQGRMNWNDAFSKCVSIGTRLPTIEELKAAYALKVTESWEKEGDYWSSTTDSDDRTYALDVDNGKNKGENSRSNRLGVRCVRSKETKVNLDTGRWSQYQGRMNWDKAMEKCVSIGLRLPTIEELIAASFTDITIHWRKDGYDYWSSSRPDAPDANRADDESAYHLNIDGGKYAYSSAYERHVRCLR